MTSPSPLTPQFGTDGVRGLANVEVTAEYALAFGRAVARVLSPQQVVVGRDTRQSGTMLEGALCAGLGAEGVDVRLLGVCPTPAVAFASATSAVPGVMISASHNPFPDNGLKVFAAGGLKLSDAQEASFGPVLGPLLHGVVGTAGARPEEGSRIRVGTVAADGQGLQGYVEHLIASIEGRRLEGLPVVIDCANGAAYEVAPRVLRSLGVELVVLANRPDGTNINAGCGSTHLQTLAATVVERGAALGLAFDGDADRVLAVDHRGLLVDGDQLIGMCALDRHRRGTLAGDRVVVTVMTNLGFRLGMQRHGIGVAETAVGDRYVLEAMEAEGLSLGGEQSGHLIFRDLASTGDGVLSAVQILDLCCRSGRTLAELAEEAMIRLPQVLRNVVVVGRAERVVTAMADQIAAVSSRLGLTGRVLVRPSGTEPLVRIMAEAPELAAAEAAVEELVAAAAALA